MTIGLIFNTLFHTIETCYRSCTGSCNDNQTVMVKMSSSYRISKTCQHINSVREAAKKSSFFSGHVH